MARSNLSAPVKTSTCCCSGSIHTVNHHVAAATIYLLHNSEIQFYLASKLLVLYSIRRTISAKFHFFSL